MKLAWFTTADRNRASSRLRAFGIAENLPGEFKSEVNVDEAADEADVIIVQKVRSEGIERNMLRWVEAGKTVVYDVDDWVDLIPPEGVSVTVGTSHLLRKYPGATVLPCLLDLPRKYPVKATHRNRIEAVCWYGDPNNQRHACYLMRACELLGIRLVMITQIDAEHERWWHRPGVEYLSWSLETIDWDILSCDLVACPLLPRGKDDHATLCKGPVRMLKAWALGMPVAGAPIEAHLAAGIVHTATSVEEWVEVLNRMQDPVVRRRDADAGIAKTDLYSTKNVVALWADFFRGLAGKAGR